MNTTPLPAKGFAIPAKGDNTNWLNQVKYTFFIAKLQHITFAVQDVTIPEVSADAVQQPTPFVQNKQPSNKAQFGDLVVTLQMAENLGAYKELFFWLMGINFPEGFQQARDFDAFQERRFGPQGRVSKTTSDATLTINNSNNLPIFRFKFPDIFPTRLSGLRVASTEPDVPAWTFQATFAVTIFTLEDAMNITEPTL